MKLQNILLLFVILIFAPISSYAQLDKQAKKKFIKKFDRYLDKEAKIKFFNYFQVVEKKGKEYVFKTFNPDKIVMPHYKTYQDEELQTLDGSYKEWYDNGNLWKEGSYENNKKSGKWSFYNHPEGRLTKYGIYKNGVEHGDWFWVDSIGRITSQYHYQNGELDGEYLKYDTVGNVFKKGIYKVGEEMKSEIIDSTYQEKEWTEIDIMPILKECSDLKGAKREACRETQFMRYIYSNIKYPENARTNGVEGKALIGFVISKEGKVTEIKVLRGISNDIENECLRIIEKSPEWSPGTSQGKPVKVYYNIPVNFRLE